MDPTKYKSIALDLYPPEADGSSSLLHATRGYLKSSRQPLFIGYLTEKDGV